MGGGGYAGAIAGGLQAYQETEYQEQEARYNQRIAEYNAAIARNQAIEQMYAEQYQEKLRRRDSQIATWSAEISLKQAGVREEETRRQGHRQIAGQRAGTGASGVAVDSGSALFAQVESARFAEFDAQVAGYGLRMDAWKSDDDAKMLLTEAENHAARAKWLQDYGIQAAGDLYDVQAKYYKQWADFSSDTKWGNLIVGAIGGFFGQKKQVKGAGSHDVNQTNALDSLKGYDYDRANDDRNFGHSRDDDETGGMGHGAGYSRNSGGEGGGSSEESFKINQGFDAGGRVSGAY